MVDYEPRDNDKWRGYRFITGGNATLLYFGKIMSNSHSGCPRRLLLRNYGIEPPIDEKSQAVFQNGFDWEAHVLVSLKDKGYKVEEDVKKKVALSDKTNWTVSADFIVNDEIVVETKSVNSDKRAKEVFIHGKFKTEHMLQLAQYMFIFGKSSGVLLYGHMGSDYTYKYRSVKKEIKKFDSKQFLLNRQENGKYVWKDPDNGEEGLFVANDENIARTLEYLKWVLEENVHDCLEPIGWSEYVNPCSYCQFNKVCEKLPKNLDEFVGECKKVVEELIQEIEASKQPEEFEQPSSNCEDDVPF